MNKPLYWVVRGGTEKGNGTYLDVIGPFPTIGPLYTCWNFSQQKATRFHTKKEAQKAAKKAGGIARVVAVVRRLTRREYEALDRRMVGAEKRLAQVAALLAKYSKKKKG